MILNAILTLYIGALDAVLGVLPSLPATPTAITNGGNWLIDLIAGVSSMLRAIYSPALLTGIIVILIAILAFDYIYFALLWALKKIPMINIK